MATASPPGLRPLTRRVPYGGTGLSVSRLCWGTGLMADLRHHMEPEAAAAILLRGYELGVNFWDTADGYRTHPHVALALSRVDRERVVVNSKTRARTAADATADVDRFLRELGTDYVDTLLLHNVETVESLDARAGALEALLAARTAGKLRAVG